MPPGRGVPRAGFAVRCPFPPYNTMPPRKRPMPQCLRAAYMRPLQCEGNAIQTVNRRHGHRFAGGIYAAPTHGPNAVTTQNRYRGANGHGPHACGPYGPAVNGRRMGKAGLCRDYEGGVKTPPYRA